MANINQPINQQSAPETTPEPEQTKSKNNFKLPEFLKKLAAVFKNVKLPFDIPPSLKQSYSKIPKTLKIVLFGVFGLLFLLIVVGGVVSLFGREKPEPKPLDVPTPAPHSQFDQGENTRPSAYATDSAILVFEQEINDVNKRLNEVDLINSLLLPPNIEFDINFDN